LWIRRRWRRQAPDSVGKSFDGCALAEWCEGVVAAPAPALGCLIDVFPLTRDPGVCFELGENRVQRPAVDARRTDEAQPVVTTSTVFDEGAENLQHRHAWATHALDSIMPHYRKSTEGNETQWNAGLEVSRAEQACGYDCRRDGRRNPDSYGECRHLLSGADVPVPGGRASESMTQTSMSLETDRLWLHEVLFPLDERQLAALREIAPGEAARDALIAMHGGVVDALRSAARGAGASADVVDWILLRDEPLAAEFLAHLDGRRELRAHAASVLGREIDRGVPAGDAYCSLLPQDNRHRLGEHYTPWSVVRRIADRVDEGQVAVDPACGDGRFLVELLRRRHDPEALWGGDLNPLAVAMARWEIWNTLDRPKMPPQVMVSWIDFLIGDAEHGLSAWAPQRPKGARQASHFVGNPPWVLWRNLGPTYRNAIAKVYGSTRLNQARGWGARVSAGQTDVAYLFLHEAVERVGSRGHVSFVMPRSLLKSPVGASVVRGGKTVRGRPFRYSRVLDYAKAPVFELVRTDTIVALVDTDQAQAFPVPWEIINDPDSQGQESPAWPSDPDDPTSPWTNGNEAPPLVLLPDARRSTIVARGGINTGGGNGVFHVDVTAITEEVVTVRNRPSRGFPSRVMEAPIETEYVRPLLRGKDVGKWHAAPSGWIVVPHRVDDPRKPIEEETIGAKAPLLLAYLRTFHEELRTRKELARWGGPWYSLFRIGFYTAGCWRVVWPCSAGQKLRAAVLTAEDRTVPDQSVVLVPFDSPEPAFFLCAVLNSSIVRSAIASGAGLDASPNLVRRIVLPSWDPHNDVHRAISGVAAVASAGEDVSQQALDGLVEELYVSHANRLASVNQAPPSPTPSRGPASLGTPLAVGRLMGM
jgi:N-6 DNA methylase